jgi:biopolymer transport protein TolR
MGMSGGGGGTSKHVSSDINVTPLIDVLLVLLIIFLVVMPIMMELTVPRNLDDINEQPDPNQIFLSAKLQADQTIIWNDGTGPDEVIQRTQLLQMLKPKIAAFKQGAEKVVFVDFADNVKWADVVDVMDTIRGLATDEHKNEIKVALTVCEPEKRKTEGCEKAQ